MSASLALRQSEWEVEDSATPMRIAMLVGGLGLGGAERQAIELAAGLVRAGQQVRMFALSDGPLRAEAVARGIALELVERPFAFSPAAAPAVGRAVARYAPQVLYAFLEVQWLLATAALRWSPGTRIVWGLRTGHYAPPEGLGRARAVHALVRRSAPRAALLIANSASGLREFRCVYPEAPRGVVIPNGIDASTLAPLPCAGRELRRSWGIADGVRVIGHVGRLDPVKNHEGLIDAFANVAQSDSAVHLVCVGDGSDARSDALRSRAVQRQIGDRVHFAGPRRDLAAVYSAFDLLALASHREGFPNVVAEAMACGIPAVVTATGGAPDVVGSLGEVVPTGDDAALADGIRRLLQRIDGAGALTLRASCRNRILSHFSVAQCVARTLDAFHSLALAPTTRS